MTTMDKKRDVTLLLPGLMHIEQEGLRLFAREAAKQGERLPGLELILSRARKQDAAAMSFEALLFSQFGMYQAEDQDVPVAALNWLLYHGEVSSQWMMRADPVNVQANRDHLMMLGNDMLEIQDDEAYRLVKDINAAYADTHWQLYALSPLHWVIKASRDLDLRTYPLKNVLGMNISQYLPHGPDSAAWHAVMNELQMFLHGHPVNRERNARGLPEINSVWLWGGGVLPAAGNNDSPPAWVQCWSNNAMTQALARLKHVPRVELPRDGNAWLNQAISGGAHLLVLDDLQVPIHVLDPYQWWQDLRRCDAQWLQPLVGALQQGSIARLALITDGGPCYLLTSARAKRWWKPIRRLGKS